jgi:ABC-type bacteriocin/lantibiotic exporter with double-glycine peptidase domain
MKIMMIIFSTIFFAGILSYPHSLFVKFKIQEKDLIDYDVPPLKQDCDDYCWAACILMIRNYYYQESRYRQFDIASMVRPKLPKEVLNCKRGVYKDEYENALEYWGFKIYPPGCFMPEAWYDLLEEKGPLLVALFIDQESQHVVVLKGMSDKSSNPTMYVIDPWTGQEIFVPYDLFEKTFEKIGEVDPNDFTIVAYFDKTSLK